MSARSWDDVQRQFRRVVLMRGDRSVMDFVETLRVPVSRATVYRLMACSVQRPSRALRQAIEHVLDLGVPGKTID